MPVLLRRGHAGNFSDELLSQHVLCANMAVQCMTPAQIHKLLVGEPGAEDVNLLCCMVTDLASEDGSPLWCAAVTPNSQICSSDETLIVPMSAQWVRGALLRGIAGFKYLEFPENSMLRKLICAHRSARGAEPAHSIATLGCNTPEVACVQTTHALLAVHVPPRPCPYKRLSCYNSVGICPKEQWWWSELPAEIQSAIVHSCLTNGGDARSLRVVCRAFRAVVDKEVNAVKKLLVAAVGAADACRADSVGKAAARMGLRPVHMYETGSVRGLGRVRACAS